MRRSLASDYLLEVHGISLKSGSLAKAAVRGDGPPYHKDGKTPLYPRVGLDEYAVKRLGPLRCSTSDEI